MAMDKWAILAGCLAISSVALAMYEVTMHLKNFTKPYLQRYIVRILLMVPIYSLNAWFAMLVPVTGLYLDSLREVYESFVIYSFMKYLLNFLNYDTNLQQYIDFKPGPSQILPFCCLPACVGGQKFLLKCKHGILQYVVVRPTTTLIAFASQQFGFYGEGNFNPLKGYTYPILLIINNISQVLAMYCLVIFYTGYQRELRPMRPLTKFLSIKLVVFFSFFQSVVISVLLEIKLVQKTLEQLFPDVDGKIALGRKVQELLICFDMLVAAVGHLFAFTYKPYTDPADGQSARLVNAAQRSAPQAGGVFTSSSGRVANGWPTSFSWSWSPRPSLAPQVHESQPQPSRAAPSPEDPEQCFNAGPSSCCSAFRSILDFSEDKRDFSEHFQGIYAKTRQVLSLSKKLPEIHSVGPANGPEARQDYLEPSLTGRRNVGGIVAADEGGGTMPRKYQSID